MTGSCTSAALLGRPDVGLLTMTEMVDNARRIADCVDIPVIADADTGYGNPLNVIRTVGAYEAAGVAAIHLEDQVAPKKCGHMDGSRSSRPGEMAQKIRAAVEARTRPDFVIIARTDARAVEGLERALDRARLYREAGADALFIEAVTSQDEAAEAARAFPDVPLLFNWAEGGKTPPIGLDRLRELGYQIVIFPISTLLAATVGMRRVLDEIARSGTPAGALGELPAFGDFLDFIGLPGGTRGGATVRLLTPVPEPAAGPVQPGPGFPPGEHAASQRLTHWPAGRTISRPWTRPSGVDGRHRPPSSPTSSQT